MSGENLLPVSNDLKVKLSILEDEKDIPHEPNAIATKEDCSEKKPDYKSGSDYKKSAEIVSNAYRSSKDFFVHRLSSQEFPDDYTLSYFHDVDLAFPVPVFQLTAEYKVDHFKGKINLGVGAYRTEEGLPWVLPVVKYVESQIAMDPLLTHEYLPILGLPDFCEAAMRLCLGKNSLALVENRAGAVQSLSGTGALRLAAEFLYRFYNKREASTAVYLSNPTWENHVGIFKSAGFSDIRQYRYWNEEGRCLDTEGMFIDLKNARRFSIVVFHTCAHNPTGVDPSNEEWEMLAQICTEKRLFPIFDCAYQGFASGDPEIDAWGIRHFVKTGFEMLVCQSFAKIFGLYDERVGNLVLVLRDALTQMKCRSQMKQIIRTMYSNPPSHGARIVAAVLNNSALREEWLENLRSMVDRIKDMRHLLHSKLRIMGTPGSWNHIIKQLGMFCYTGLNPQEVEHLVTKKHIYLLQSGRINISGLNEENIDYFVQSFDEAVRLPVVC